MYRRSGNTAVPASASDAAHHRGGMGSLCIFDYVGVFLSFNFAHLIMPRGVRSVDAAPKQRASSSAREAPRMSRGHEGVSAARASKSASSAAPSTFDSGLMCPGVRLAQPYVPSREEAKGAGAPKGQRGQRGAVLGRGVAGRASGAAAAASSIGRRHGAAKAAASKDSQDSEEEAAGGFGAQVQTLKRDIAHLRQLFPGAFPSLRFSSRYICVFTTNLRPPFLLLR